MTILEALLSDLPTRWHVTNIYVGANWVLSQIKHDDRTERAGVATSPHPILPDAQFQIGQHSLDKQAEVVAQWLRSSDGTAAAVGLATINALNQPHDHLLVSADAADWLAAQCIGRNVAIFGRFPLTTRFVPMREVYGFLNRIPKVMSWIVRR